MDYAIKLETDEELASVEARLREHLAAEGFGILTEIDVQATLKTKIDVDVAPYKILGACNPKFAHKGLGAEPDLGVLLPCNVCLYEQDGKTVVSAMKPTAALSLVSNPAVEELATEVERIITGAIQSALTAPAA